MRDLVDLALSRVVGELARINVERGPGKPHFEDPRYSAKEFSAENLKNLEKGDRTICFVDGGSAIIVEAPNFVLASHRVYYSKYKGAERTRQKMPNMLEFFSLTVSMPAPKGGINYETKIYYDDQNATAVIPDSADLVFDSFDKTMTSGPARADISKVSMTAREFAEWRMIEAVSEIEDAEIIVRDGSLQTIKTNESKYAKAAADACDKKGIALCGVSKTSTLLTTTGLPLLSAINKIAGDSGMREGGWYYENIVEINHPDHNAEMFVAKLHPAAEYVFRVEISKPSLGKRGAGEIISGLAANATDLTFPGYPYGLINSDVMGRIPNEEMKYQKAKIFALNASLRTDARARDAHGVLDSM
ncbi:MAG: hypothetical protein HYS53_01410 [Candidatus Aenigmarchaeota archaeon]|nr:hypothetical protein [Candidatus Aenigmarchaeota archaeon]